jgi:hypothetical protein
VSRPEHFFHTVPGFFDFREVYDDVLDRIANTGTWVEVGSWQGKSIAYAVVESMARSLDIKFHCVDIWKLSDKHKNDQLRTDHDLYRAFLHNTAPIQSHINVIREFSWEAADRFQDASVDFVMIDADHSFEAVAKDLAAWYPKIKKGGIMAGDDLSKRFPGVQQAVQNFCDTHQINWHKHNRCWTFTKT